MRVAVDLERCIGSGMCTTYVPQVFQLAPDGSYAIVLEDSVPAGLEGAVEDAVACCPTEAISADASDWG
jgi:ferredoxin